MYIKYGVWLTHGLGDTIMTLPLLSKLSLEGERVLLIVKSEIIEELINLAFRESPNKPLVLLYSRKLVLIKYILNNKFDNFLFVHGTSSIKYAILSLFIRAKNKVGVLSKNKLKNFFYSKTIESDNLHKVNYFLLFGGYLPIEKYPHIFNIKHENSNKEKKIVIAPGSGVIEKHKRWPEKKWGELISKINNIGPLEIIIFGSKNEEQLLNSIKKESLISNVKIFLANNITESIDFLSTANLVVSVCNGTSHLAAILGVGVVGLYGPTNYTFTGVFGDKFSPVFKGFSCSPCYRPNFIKGCGNPECMKRIEVNDVLPLVEKGIRGEFINEKHYIINKQSTLFSK